MKTPFGFGRRSGGKNTYRRFSDEEYMDEEYSDGEYPEEEYEEVEYTDEEYVEEEYTDEEYVEEEYTDEEYVEEEYTDEEYVEEEYTDEEYVEEEYTDEEYVEEEYTDEEYLEEYIDEEYEEVESSEEEEYEDAATIIFDQMEFDEISYEEEEYDQDSYEKDDSYEEYDYSYEEEAEEGLFPNFNISGLIDKLVTIGGAAILIVGLVVGGMFVYKRMNVPTEETFLNVGSQLTQIEVIGQSGLLAVSDAQKAAIEAAKLKEQEKEETSTEYEEEEYKTEVDVKLSVSSIEKDLKIKFINQDTGKLVGNVPFGIQVTDPDGKGSFWSDDDMDGIIYKKNLKAGKYTIKVNAFQDAKYKKYGIPSAEHKVEVKATIEYKKVDVANEVKSESQVDVQKEDTKKKETVVESYLTDTVTWVESTATLVSYTEEAKENIVDPMKPLVNTGNVKVTIMQQVSGSDANPGLPDASDSSSQEATVPTVPVVIEPEFEAVTVYADLQAVLTVTGMENDKENIVITAESSDTNVATVSVLDGMITITGVNAGETSITLNCAAEVKENETIQTFHAEPTVFKVTVHVNPQKDITTVLKDNLDREVYVLENQEYRVAKHADYYTHSNFFVKGEAKYTGWQTLEGRRFYFDASGKAVTGEQVIQGVKYNFASDGALVTGSGTLGIDVSKWNGSIDWAEVKNSGVSYVIIRCGYRGSSEGALIKDSKFEENIKGAINAGLKVGVYFFSQAVDKSEAVEEASMVLECVKNYKISYPIFLDVEPSGGRADKIDAATRTEICRTFCETIQSYGYTAGIYANRTWLTEKINTSELSSSYKIWLAQYASEPTYTGRYDMWQYKSTGKISGISGDVDMNLSYLGY